jgi:hypothetical protein
MTLLPAVVGVFGPVSTVPLGPRCHLVGLGGHADGAPSSCRRVLASISTVGRFSLASYFAAFGCHPKAAGAEVAAKSLHMRLIP